MGLIPTKNPLALIGYYLGIFSLVPCVGLALSVPAIICGILGIVKANAEPEAEGKGHAIAAVVLGAVGLLLWGGLALFMLVVAPML